MWRRQTPLRQQWSQGRLPAQLWAPPRWTQLHTAFHITLNKGRGQDRPARVGVLGYLSLRVGAGSHTQHQAGSRGKEAGAEGRAGHETGEISLKKAVHPLLTLYIPHLELLLLNVGILTSILEGNRLKEVKPTNVKNACGLWS